MFYLFVALKLPIVAAIWLVYWAIKQEPDPSEDVRDDGGTSKRRHPSRRCRAARAAGRTPSPRRPHRPRVRPLRARGRRIVR